MINVEKKINADVRVVKMENWTRSMWFDQTNQTWINPSPNMRSLTEATLYPESVFWNTQFIGRSRNRHAV
jgi:uncharacterized protein YbbC (DUF1343 family)